MFAKDVMTGADLRLWRLERGLTQSQLAAALDKTQKTISTWEINDEQSLKLSVREALVAIENPDQAARFRAWQTVLQQGIQWLLANGHMHPVSDKALDRILRKTVAELAQAEKAKTDDAAA